jgi:predicted metal-dependent peptidase
MTPKEFQAMLDKPSVKFILDHTMFAQLFYSFDHVLIPDDDPMFAARGQHATAYCDGKEMGVNPTFFQALTVPQQISLLAHETLHGALEHPWRLGNRDVMLANVAMDFEVNALLVENKFAELPNWLYDAKYAGWPFEKIYDDLLKNATVVRLPGGAGASGQGGKMMKDKDGNPVIILPMPDVGECPGSTDEKEEAKSRMQSKVVNAARMAEKMQGNIPAAFKRLIDKILCPKLPWHELMRRYFKSITFNDYDWRRPDRHGYAKTGLIQPRLYSEQLDCLATFIDTSGSIGQEELSEFAFHFNGCRAESNPRKTYLGYIDAEICGKVEEYDQSQDIAFEARGGGGTDFRPAFEWLEKQGIVPDVMIYFTDMYGIFPKKAPDYPVLWVTKTEGFEPPFGEVINFDDK